MGGALVDKGLAAYKLPAVAVEAAKFLLHLQKEFGIIDGCRNFKAIADYIGIVKEGCDFRLAEACYFLWVEIAKSLAVSFAFLYYGGPA